MLSAATVGPVPIFFCGGGGALGLPGLSRGAAIAWPWTRVNPARCNRRVDLSGEYQLKVVV